MGRRGGIKARLVLALLIALTSVLGAVAAWRASVASSAAGDADRRGFEDSVNRQLARANVSQSVDSAVSYFVRWKAYLAQARELSHQARAASGQTADVLDEQAEAYRSLARITAAGVDEEALNPDGSLNVRRVYQIQWEQAKRDSDVDPTPDYAEADSLKEKSEQLVGLTALMIAAALFLTLAGISKTRARSVYAVGGVAVLVVAASLLVAREVL